MHYRSCMIAATNDAAPAAAAAP
eukprot:SAG31_NODE_41661_length_275_cov_0.585227_1_plen_22_part_10